MKHPDDSGTAHGGTAQEGAAHEGTGVRETTTPVDARAGSFAALGLPEAVLRTLDEQGMRDPSRSRPPPFLTPCADATSWDAGAPAPARRSPSASPC